MFWILIAILGICIIILVFIGVCDILYLYPKRNCTRLSYNQFVDYYWVNPDKWELYSNYVEYKIHNEYLSGIMAYGYERFTFPYIDIVKYHYFKYKIETKKEKYDRANRDSKAYKNLLDNVQKDIGMLKKQSQDELNKAMNIMKEVKERVG